MDVDFVTGVPINIDLTGQTGIDVIFGGYGGNHAPSIPGWNDISGKPTAFPTDWNTVTGKPSTFPAGWDDVTGKPTTFVPEPTLVVSAMQTALTAEKGVAVTNSGSTMKVTEGPLRAAFEKLYASSGANAIGDMTIGGGIASAFDGTTSKNGALCSGKASSSAAYVGQNCTASPIVFSRAIIYGSTSDGFLVGSNIAMAINIRGKTGTAPSSSSDGTILGSLSFTDTSSENGGRSVIGTDLFSAWDYIWAELVPSVSAATRVAQVVLYCIDSLPAARRPSLRNADFLNIRDINSAACTGQDIDTATWNTLVDDINSGFMKSWRIPNATSVIDASLTAITSDRFTIKGEGYASKLQMAATAGNVSTFLSVGNSSTAINEWLLSELAFECLNTASITTAAPAINVKASTRGAMDMLRFNNVAGGIKIGDTAIGGVANQTRMTRLSLVQATALGGIGLDIQSSADHLLAHSTFGGTGTAASAFRGLRFKPAVTDTSDAGRFLGLAFNYPVPNPLYNIELDATANHIASQQFVNCVFDQAVSGANVWLHIDSGADVATFFNSVTFTNCISNASTNTTPLLLNNAGGKPFDMTWLGGQLSTVSSNGCVRLEGGNRIDASIRSVGFTRRNTTGTANGAIVVADGCSGLKAEGCYIKTRNDPTGATPYVPYSNLVYFEGNASDCIIVGNDAKAATTGLISEASVTAANKATIIVDKNLGPSGPVHGRGPMTVASLPSATRAGHREVVTDATATTFMSTVAGSGSNIVPVVADGTNWKIG